MSDLWLKIPAPIRSSLRVAAGALLVWLLTDGVQLLTDSPLPLWLKGLLLAVVVPALRALDPTETSFGVGVVDPVGKHEAL
jgi:hypothetical protein